MQTWNQFLDAISIKLGDGTVQKWLRPLKVVHFDACNLYLEAESSFQIDWFEEHIRPKFSSKFLNANGRLIKIHITSSSLPPITKEKKGIKAAPLNTLPSFTLAKDSLFPEYTQERFIFASGNKLLESLFTKLISSEDKTFNPIFLYGGPSSGKTHLLQALAFALQQKGHNALYVKIETFTENVVQAIRNSSMQEFRKAYRNVDALLIDDVQHLAGKNATQEEFFHTFNALHGLNKQIVLTSPVSPSLLLNIEPRLTSRFEWGLSLPILKLEKNDLFLVAENRCKQLDLHLPEDGLHFILEIFKLNLSSIQRALEALYLRTNGEKKNLTLSYIKTLLKDLIHKEESSLTPDKLLSYIAEFYQVPAQEIRGKSQTKEYSTPRQIAMFFFRQNLKMPFAKIGQYFQRDHSTVMTSVKAIEEKLSTGDSEIRAAWQKLTQKLAEKDPSR